MEEKNQYLKEVGIFHDRNTYQISTFSEHGSFRIISGAIQATVPVNVILALVSESSLHVPKSDILMISLYEIKMLQDNINTSSKCKQDELMHLNN